MLFIATLAGLLLADQVAIHLCRRVEIPGVVGEILIGVILGPALLGWVHLNSLLNEFQVIGVIILMFIGGLESDLNLLKKYIKPAMVVAVMGVVVPFAVMGLASYAFGFPWLASLFIGTIFSATSISISISVMNEYHYLETKEGTVILGAAIVDDIIGVLMLSLLVGFMSGGNQASGHTTNIGLLLLEQAGFFVLVYLLVRWLAPYLMRLGEHLLSQVSETVMSLVICLSLAAAAEFVGLSAAVGAFFAGVAVAQTKSHSKVEHGIEPIGYAVFIPIFFISIGLNIKFEHLLESLPFIIIMTILACLTKLLGCGLGAKMNGFTLDSSYLVGAGMISRGEMALITAQIGFEAHLLSEMYYTDVIIVIVLATVIAPFMLKHAIKRHAKHEVSAV